MCMGLSESDRVGGFADVLGECFGDTNDFLNDLDHFVSVHADALKATQPVDMFGVLETPLP